MAFMKPIGIRSVTQSSYILTLFQPDHECERTPRHSPPSPASSSAPEEQPTLFHFISTPVRGDSDVEGDFVDGRVSGDIFITQGDRDLIESDQLASGC